MVLLEDEADPLCCCEYNNVRGERAHLCGLVCDCAELDEAVDRLVKGQKMPEKRYEAILEVVEDRMRLPWPRGAIKLPMDKITPWIIVPLLFNAASGSWQTQLLVHGMVLPLLIFCKYRTCLRSYRPGTKFFVMWSMATFAFLFYVYQFQVVGLVHWPKTVSPLENLCLMGFLGGATVSLYMIKTHNHGLNNDNGHLGLQQQLQKRSKFCKICEAHVPDKDHHCVWIDACISEANMPYFLSFLVCILMALVYAGLIFLTSVCLPLQELGPFILIPDRWCQRWNTHFEGNVHLTWTAGIHCFLLAIPVAFLLVAKGSTYLIRLLSIYSSRAKE